jgi:hypothetical protein
MMSALLRFDGESRQLGSSAKSSTNHRPNALRAEADPIDLTGVV